MTWMQTHTGRAFSYEDLLAGRDVAIDPTDIAVSLSRVNRFLGHTTHRSWSVAQHSLAMSAYVAPEHALAALLHDAAEAYVGDLPAPLRWTMRELAKASRTISYYEHIECLVSIAIERWAGLEDGAFRRAEIKEADLRMLATERDLFMFAPQPADWIPLPPPFDITEHPKLWDDWSPDQIAGVFLKRLAALGGPS